MPGRIKYHNSAHNALHTHQHMKPHVHLSLHRRQDPAPAAAAPNQDNPNAASSLFDNQAPDAKSFVLNKQTIIWLVVISVIVLATLITVTCLLCKCKRRRKGKDGKGGAKRHSMKDERNEFPAWNRNAPPRASLAEQGGFRGDGGAEAVRMETWDTQGSTAPLRPSPAAIGAGIGNAVMEPVVVDYAQSAQPKKNSRYYSNLNSGNVSRRGSIWKRMSQIGRAY